MIVPFIITVLFFLVLAGGVYAAWDIAKRKLEIENSKLSLQRYESAVLLAFQEYCERNDKALTNFLTQMRELANYQKTELQNSKGSQLNQNLNGRWRNNK